MSRSEETIDSRTGGDHHDQNYRGLSANDIVLPNRSTGVPSIKRLQDAGVTFKKSEGGRLSDVHFDERNGVLSLPFLVIDDDTAAKFMNLIAFESMHPRAEGQVTSYFTDALVDSGKDVRILTSQGIVRWGAATPLLISSTAWAMASRTQTYVRNGSFWH